MASDTTEFLRYYLWDRPFRGVRVPPWVARKVAETWARQQERLAALREQTLFSGPSAEDCEPAPGNRYRSYRPYRRDDLFDLRAILVETDRDLFGGLFVEHGILPDIDWWWRGAKLESKSAVLGMAFLRENRILIHFRFGQPGCPENAVQLLVYHELLHIALYRAGLPFGHTGAFQALEGQFPGFAQADKAMDDYSKREVHGRTIGKSKPPRHLHDLKRIQEDPPKVAALRTHLRARLQTAA